LYASGRDSKLIGVLSDSIFVAVLTDSNHVLTGVSSDGLASSDGCSIITIDSPVSSIYLTLMVDHNGIEILSLLSLLGYQDQIIFVLAVSTISAVIKSQLSHPTISTHSRI
jgi:hypothetical protein